MIPLSCLKNAELSASGGPDHIVSAAKVDGSCQARFFGISCLLVVAAHVTCANAAVTVHGVAEGLGDFSTSVRVFRVLAYCWSDRNAATSQRLQDRVVVE